MNISMSRRILANVKLTLQEKNDKKVYYCLSSIKKKGQFPKAYSYTCKSSINEYLCKNNYVVFSDDEFLILGFLVEK